jgi:sodium-independent sulfate anion transporter 11
LGTSIKVNTGNPTKKCNILTQTVGFSHAGVPAMDGELFGLIASELPSIVVILIVEHIAIAKSFGRIFGYTINSSQEMIAQGASNILSPFVGGYVCTGSFGASAVLSKAAVRTPLAGLFSAAVLVLALYALTSVFYYIPNAALAGLIIHCTINLLTPPKALYKYWQLSPFELFIWVCGVVIGFFRDLETAIYTTIGLSFALLLIRLARAPGRFQGSRTVTKVACNNHLSDAASSHTRSEKINAACIGMSREIFVPYDHSDGHNPGINAQPAYPGVFIYRFSENFNYANQAFHIDHLTSYIKSHTRQNRADDGISTADRLWCDAIPASRSTEKPCTLPALRAIVLDFSTVNIIDITSIQGLVDLRSSLDRYEAPTPVEWHFAGVHNRWTRRALAFAGFGLPAIENPEGLGSWCPIYTVSTSLAGATLDEQHDMEVMRLEKRAADEEGSRKSIVQQGEHISRISLQDNRGLSVLQPVYGVDRPFFHVDLHAAVDCAVTDAKRQDDRRTHFTESNTGRSSATDV